MFYLVAQLQRGHVSLCVEWIMAPALGKGVKVAAEKG